MEKAVLTRRVARIVMFAVASLLLLGGGTIGVAAAGNHGGGFHGGGGFHSGFRGGGGGGFHGGFHGGGGFRGGRFGGYYGHGFYGGGYPGYFRHGPGWGGWGPGWGLGLGLYLPVLPWYATTFWWDDVPYYDVENNYYVWDSAQDEYEQVQPPTEVAQQAQDGSQAPQVPPQLYAYPKKGQTARQQATDKRECSSWASAQTGVDPPGGGPVGNTPSSPSNGKASPPAPDQASPAAGGDTPAGAQAWQNYLRAETACLQARGYTVD